MSFWLVIVLSLAGIFALDTIAKVVMHAMEARTIIAHAAAMKSHNELARARIEAGLGPEEK